MGRHATTVGGIMNEDLARHMGVSVQPAVGPIILLDVVRAGELEVPLLKNDDSGGRP